MKHPLLKDIIISPPFGKWLNFSWATSVGGSYTILHRPGIIKQAIKTIRKTKLGWVNRTELRNPGLLSHPAKLDRDKIISFVALRPEDWDIFLYSIPSYHMVEINLGCPNSENALIVPSTFEDFVNKYKLVTVKLPGVLSQALEYFEIAYSGGARIFHICNTIPVKQGGLSGQRVKELSLRIISIIRSEGYNSVTIIAGGGIYTPIDVIDYKNAGADHFSLSTIWFTPWRVSAVVKEINFQ
ncbi:MAG: hypothetical protein ACREAU_00010 [Nitrosopumilaceae archaeon]